jgi:hypothetical protein
MDARTLMDALALWEGTPNLSAGGPGTRLLPNHLDHPRRTFF